MILSAAAQRPKWEVRAGPGKSQVYKVPNPALPYLQELLQSLCACSRLCSNVNFLVMSSLTSHLASHLSFLFYLFAPEVGGPWDRYFWEVGNVWVRRLKCLGFLAGLDLPVCFI